VSIKGAINCAASYTIPFAGARRFLRWFFLFSRYHIFMKIIGHRGASACAPENTMTAFRLAWSEGAAGIELDVQMTSDREIIVFHDITGERLAGDRRALSELSWREVSEWDVGVGKSTIYQGTHVPHLYEVLHEAPRDNLILIEIKSGPEIIPDLHHLLSTYRNKTFAILTFDIQTAMLAVKALTHTPVYLNVEAEDAFKIDAILSTVAQNGLHGISLGWSDRVDEALVNKVHHAGLPLAVWTVNETKEVLRAQKIGVDLLMTDRPEIMVPLVKHD